MIWHRDEAEVDKMIEDMSSRTKGKYITQGVSFNKTCPRQIAMLKMALMESASFSGLIKELLAQKMVGGAIKVASQPESKPKNKNTGNFL
jgi:predicted CopG family antitoxin